MNLNNPTPLKLAILNLYNGTPNQGMRAIRDIVDEFAGEIEWDEFDVRAKGDLPDTGYDIYISSGGPDDPRDGDGKGDGGWYRLMDDLWKINNSESGEKKFVFFICHSFQMACDHFEVGMVTERKSQSFGTFPCHKTEAGKKEMVFMALEDPFWIADFRSYQVVQPNQERLEELGAKILAIEKERPHVPLERATMAVRFSEEMLGVQFHPEADPKGMLVHFGEKARQEMVTKSYGREKLRQMIKDLQDPAKIERTRNVVLPTFLNHAIRTLRSSLVTEPE